jgi:phenylacetic acid degradation operon negative regulatory protein
VATNPVAEPYPAPVDRAAVDLGAQARPRSLIVTIFGAYARQSGGWLSVAALVRLLSAVGVEEAAVRSSVSRLKRRGVLVAERRDGAAGYGLSQPFLTELDEGDRRIFSRPAGRLEDGWVLAAFSVPESERRMRHQLRSRLTWLGFGTVAPGVRIAPAHLADDARQVLVRVGLSAYVDLFRADYLDFADLRQEVGRWWDLEGLAVRYGGFVQAWQPVLTSWRRRRTVEPREAFGDYVAALDAWRRLPFLDPGLPAELLPRGWQGTRAADVFFGLREKLAEPAHELVDAVR